MNYLYLLKSNMSRQFQSHEKSIARVPIIGKNYLFYIFFKVSRRIWFNKKKKTFIKHI